MSAGCAPNSTDHGLVLPDAWAFGSVPALSPLWNSPPFPPHSQHSNSTIQLESVPYGTDGQFAINIWFAVDTTQPLQGFEWLYSHTDSNAITIGMPNQVQPCGPGHAGKRGGRLGGLRVA